LQRAKQARRQMEETQRELQRTKQARRTIRRR
jgi:hypothetical protein